MSEVCVVKGRSLVTGMMFESRGRVLVRYTLASSNCVVCLSTLCARLTKMGATKTHLGQVSKKISQIIIVCFPVEVSFCTANETVEQLVDGEARFGERGRSWRLALQLEESEEGRV